MKIQVVIRLKLHSEFFDQNDELSKYFGLDVNIQKEWKISKSTKPKTFIKGFRNFPLGQRVEGKPLQLES